MQATRTPPTVTFDAAPTPADILRDAAAYLQLHGWFQGDMFDDPDRPFPAACAVGAIRMAVCGTPTIGQYEPDQAQQIKHALTVLADHVTDGDEDDELTRPTPGEAVFDWNDYDRRTAAEVITAINEAADEWDRLRQGGEPR